MAEKSRILVVDDEEPLRTILSSELVNAGYDVETASDGDEAIAEVQNKKFDLVLLDIRMPRVDGFEVLKRARADDVTKKTPIIVFSNLGQREDIEKAKSLGADDFLIKANFTLDDVVEKINTTLK